MNYIMPGKESVTNSNKNINAKKSSQDNYKPANQDQKPTQRQIGANSATSEEQNQPDNQSTQSDITTHCQDNTTVETEEGETNTGKIVGSIERDTIATFSSASTISALSQHNAILRSETDNKNEKGRNNTNQIEAFKQKMNIHILTDSTGETTINICKVTMSQFPNLECEMFCWPFVKQIADVQTALESVKQNPGIVIYTILPPAVISYIQEQLKDNHKVMIVHALSNVIQSFAKYTGVKKNNIIARNTVGDEEYLNKMDAIQYAVEHDDGKKIEEACNADIIILGVSRISKTPTSFYLAFREYKVANIPYFINSKAIKDLYKPMKAIIVGLTIDPFRLMQLRQNRSLGSEDELPKNPNYTNIDYIQEELEECKYLFSRLSCPIIDVTHKSVEEVSAQIIRVHNFLRKTKK